MKKLSFAVAMLAAVSMVVTPVSPSFAQEQSRFAAAVEAQSANPKEAREKITRHAERGEAAILSKAQVDRLAKSNPKLHAKLMKAYNAGTAPSLTPAEKKMLVATTQANLKDYKAGSPAHAAALSSAALATGGWIVVLLLAIIGIALFLQLFTNFFGARAGQHW